MSEASPIKVALVASSGHVGRIVREALAHAGFDLRSATDITQVIASSRRVPIQALVLDDSAGNAQDWLAAFELHASPAAAVMIVGPVRPQGFADLLARGATDYVEMSAVSSQLAPRLRARVASLPPGPPPAAAAGGYSLDERISALRAGTREVGLTRREFALAQVLFAHQGKPVSIAAIAAHLWSPGPAGSPRMVEQHAGSLRRKLLAHGCGDVSIRAVAGIGYRLDIEPDRPATGRRRAAGLSLH